MNRYEILEKVAGLGAEFVRAAKREEARKAALKVAHRKGVMKGAAGAAALGGAAALVNKVRNRKES